jgi:hypothetical protein
MPQKRMVPKYNIGQNVHVMNHILDQPELATVIEVYRLTRNNDEIAGFAYLVRVVLSKLEKIALEHDLIP